MIPERNILVDFDGRPVKFVETVPVRDGVECDVYEFVGDTTEDLGVIRVAPHKDTPWQRVNLDPEVEITSTVEGYMSGSGVLEIRRLNKKPKVYVVDPTTGRFSVNVERGEEMKWTAGDYGFVGYERCRPPYKDGRYINLE